MTAAHEFFHAIQFGYDYGEDVWLLEATATWMEERIFDDVNDNRQYLPAGQVYDSRTPLDFFTSGESQAYGNWVLFEFLSKNFGNGVVKKIWNKASAFKRPDYYSTQAINQVLKQKGGFKKVYSRFVSANLLPAKFYPEGQAWPSTLLGNTYTLSKADRRTGKHGSGLLHIGRWPRGEVVHLAGQQEVAAQGEDRGPGSYRMPAAYVLVVKRKGTEKHFVRLNGKGNGQVVVPFGRKQVKSVYISLVNASTQLKSGGITPTRARASPSTTAAASRASATSSAHRSSNAADHSVLYADRRHRHRGGGLGRPTGARGRR